MVVEGNTFGKDGAHMKKYYLAYGSNLSVVQMAHRCPNAIYVGTAEIPNYRLFFKGSKTGSYLTIEKHKGSKVPVLVWEIDVTDEKNLDCYEGYPTFYYKKEIEVELMPFIKGSKSEIINALVYIMDESRSLGSPTFQYYDTCLEGYCRFGFDCEILEQALIDSAGERMGRKMLKEVGCYV